MLKFLKPYSKEVKMNNLLQKEYDLIRKTLDVNLSGKTFLITGANGLIGSYLTDVLSYWGANVYALARSLDKLKKRFPDNNHITFIQQNLNEPLNLGNLSFDYIIHAASGAHPLSFSTDPVGIMKTNLLGTMNLLDHIRAKGGTFLYLSSGEVYGNNTDHAFTEDDLGLVDTKLTRSCYPEAKRAAETLCMAYHTQYGVDTKVARLCYIYGPTITDDNSRADAQFLRNALKHEDIVLKSKGLQKRTYCYLADAASALLYILFRGEKAQVYNVANNSSIVSVADYAKTLAEMAGVGFRFDVPDEIEARGYSKQADSILDASKLMQLGWKPKFSLEEGLSHTLQIKRDMDHVG